MSRVAAARPSAAQRRPLAKRSSEAGGARLFHAVVGFAAGTLAGAAAAEALAIPALAEAEGLVAVASATLETIPCRAQA